MNFIKSFKNKEKFPLMSISQLSLGIINSNVFTKEDVFIFINNQNKIIKNTLENKSLGKELNEDLNNLLKINNEELKALENL
jgi:hypothetical protein